MKITVIGAGAMGGAFIDGLLSSGTNPSDITATRRTSSALKAWSAKGIKTTTDNFEAAKGADIVVLAVKPWMVKDVLTQISPALDRQILICFAAGIPGKDLVVMTGKELPTFTVIPNTAIAICRSMTFIVPVAASEEDILKVRGIFEKLGESMVTDEKHLAAGTALASCGIAYAMRYIRAASEGGVELGFKAGEAERIVIQTVRGAAELLQHSGKHPEEEIDKVCTPGGITIRGLNEMEHYGFSSSVIKGLKACVK